jgi:hypothetical protein
MKTAELIRESIRRRRIEADNYEQAAKEWDKSKAKYKDRLARICRNNAARLTKEADELEAGLK